MFLRNPEIENISINDVMDYLNGMKEMGWIKTALSANAWPCENSLNFIGCKDIR